MSFTSDLNAIVTENANGLLSTAPHWGRVRVGEIADILNGAPFPSEGFNGSEGHPVVRIRNVKLGLPDTFYVGPYEEQYWITAGDLLVGMDGDFNTGFWRGPRALLNQRVCRVQPREEVYRKRLLALVLPGYLSAINRHTSAVTVKHLSSKTVADVPVPLPPLAEQDRLVAEIEKQFTRLDEAVATLEGVRAKLKRARASVLEAAVDGRLVPNEAELARAEGQSYEPASVLLQRILGERRQRWPVGKTYVPPVEPEQDGRLPDGWTWATLDQLAVVAGGVTKNSRRTELHMQVPYLRVANVYANELRMDEVKRLGIANEELDRYLLQKGDLLVVEGNGSLDQIGRAAVWDGRIHPCIHQNHLIRVRPLRPWISLWALWWMLSPEGRRSVEQTASSTSGLHTLSVSKVQRLTVRLPPAMECARIVAEVERRLSVLDALDKAVEDSLARSGRLRQSILKRAFEGKLVPQDPSDEPGSELLARIRATRSAEADQAQATPRRRTRRAS